MRYNSIKMTKAAGVDPEIQKFVEATIRYLLFVVKWLARRFALENLTKS